MAPRAEAVAGDETILVVEDVDAIRRMICAMLTHSGYNCLQASDGAEALRLLDEAVQVELVLTDIVMPNMNGSDLARHLARTRPGLRIMFMSGYTDDPVVETVGCNSPLFLPKPFTALDLTEKIRQTLDLPWSGLPNLRAGSSS
ncbi:MAG TPA: response regulator [Bryobacteraceae bacterium]|jgi:CheY-like chemotaxis protein